MGGIFTSSDIVTMIEYSFMLSVFECVIRLLKGLILERLIDTKLDLEQALNGQSTRVYERISWRSAI